MTYWFFFDLLNLCFLALQLALFGLGVLLLTRKWSPFKFMSDLPIKIAEGVLALSFVFAIAGAMNLVVVPILAAIVIGFQCFGIYYLVLNYYSLCKPPYAAFIALSTIIIIAVVFWTCVMVDFPVLVSRNDGNIHLTYLVNILNSGKPVVNHLNLGFSNIFESSHYPYYPTGTHAILAVFDYYIWHFGWIEPAEILKIWQLFVLVSIGPLFWWVSRKLFPGRSELLYLIVGLIAIAPRIYPTVPTDHAGFSRLAGYFFIFPLLTASLIYVRDFPKKLAWLLGILCIGLCSTFFFHAGALGVFSFGVGSTLLYTFLRDVRDRTFVTRSLIGSVAILVGAFFLFWFLSKTGSIEEIDSTNPAENFKLLSFKHYFSKRFAKFSSTIVHEDFHFIDGISGIPSVRQWLVYCGIAGLLFFRKNLKIDLSLKFYVIFSFAVSSLILLTFYSPSPAIFRFGLIYLHHVYRVSESMFFASTILWASGIIMISLYAPRGIQWLNTKFKTPYWKKCLVGLAVLFFFYDFQLGLNAAAHRIDSFSGKYRASRRSKTENLMNYLRANTGKDSVLVFRGRLGEDFTGRTGRLALFQLGDCPPVRSENCTARLELADAADQELHERAKTLDKKTPCMESLKTLGGEVYYLNKVGAMEKKWNIGEQLCSNFGVRYKVDRVLVWGFFGENAQKTKL